MVCGVLLLKYARLPPHIKHFLFCAPVLDVMRCRAVSGCLLLLRGSSPKPESECTYGTMARFGKPAGWWMLGMCVVILYTQRATRATATTQSRNGKDAERALRRRRQFRRKSRRVNPYVIYVMWFMIDEIIMLQRNSRKVCVVRLCAPTSRNGVTCDH